MKFSGARQPARSLRPRWQITKLDRHFMVAVLLCLLPLLFAGCFLKPQKKPLAPPIEETPALKPVPSPTQLPPPVITTPNPTPEPKPAEPPKPPPKPIIRHKKHAPPPNTTQQTSIDRPSVSAIGQLSSGDPSDLWRQTSDSLAATARGLNGIHRTLSEQENKTVAQIKEFLKQAQTALNSGDVDGAHTLAVKAKVLLNELNL